MSEQLIELVKGMFVRSPAERPPNVTLTSEQIQLLVKEANRLKSEEEAKAMAEKARKLKASSVKGADVQKQQERADEITNEDKDTMAERINEDPEARKALGLPKKE